MKRFFRGRSNGTTLVLNLLIMAVFAMMAVVVYAAAKSMVGEVVYNERSAQALATAEAGLEDALHSLYLNPNWHAGFVNKPFAGGSYTVTVTTDVPPLIASTGYSASILFKGPAVRTVAATAYFVPSACPYAVLADKALQINGRVDAYDILASLTPSATSFITGSDVRSNNGVSVGGAACPPPHIFGKVIAVGSGPAPACTSSGSVTLTTTTVVIPTFPCVNCDTINDNSTGVTPPGAVSGGANPNLTVAANTTVTLSSGTYYFNNIDIKNNGILNVKTSSGSVSIYLKNQFKTGTNCQINSTSKIPSRLHFYGINPGNTITLNCSTPLHAYLEGPQSNFDLAQELYGHFCADRVMVSSTTGHIGLMHYDLGGGVVSHVAWTTGQNGSWTESYKRQ